MERPWVAIKQSAVTKTPQVYLESQEAGSEWGLFVITDVHLDSPYCRQGLLRRHLETAVEKDYAIVSLGDFYDAMQGRHDSRGVKGHVLPELDGPDYLDRLTTYGAEFLQPYARNVLALYDGNHETAILKHNEVSLSRNTALKIRAETGARVLSPGYAGFLVFRLKQYTAQRSFIVYIHHGSGGGGPVTKGAIRHQRTQAMIERAHVTLTGHIHEQQVTTHMVHGINQAGTEYVRPVDHVTVPGYKDEYVLGRDGWHVERGRPPKPVGGALVRFGFTRAKASELWWAVEFVRW